MINGAELSVASSELSKIIEEFGPAGDAFAIAINDKFVPKANYESTRLAHGDRLEILSPMQGG